MDRAPSLRVVAAVSDLAGVANFFVEGLGLAPPRRFQEDKTKADLYAFPQGDFLAIQPEGDAGPVGAFLRARGPGIMAFGRADAAADLPAGGVPLGPGRYLSRTRLVGLPHADIEVVVDSHPDLAAAKVDGPLALDHIAYVVGDLDSAIGETAESLGARESAKVGRWRFPEFHTENAVALFDRAYVEFNRPWSTGGLFGAAYAQHKAGAVFMCLRPLGGIDSSLARLRRCGIAVAPPQRIAGISPGGESPETIGIVHGISRKASQGLRIMLFETSWPWSLLD